jgi:hypothetical protein
MHAQRGQTIPVWIFGILTSMMLMVMVFNYGNSIRWQIRSQNAADAVAQGIMSVQAQHFNQMTITLHTAAIEEYRIRRTLNAMLMVLQGSGGCTYSGGVPFDCATVYGRLRDNYIAEVSRYGQLVQQMQSVSNYTQTQQITDMNTIAQSFENTCVGSGPKGGDCIFTFAIATPTARPNLSGALVDAAGELNGDGMALPQPLVADLAPLQIEVTACALVTSPLQSFFKLNVQPFYAIGRAAATTTMVTQEWSAPGVQINPNSPGGGTTAFQPPEFVESPTNSQPGNYSSGTFCNANQPTYDWYAVKWCSNSYMSVYNPGPPQQLGGFAGIVKSDEYSVWTGWWSALPIAPYSGKFTPSAGNCAQNVAWNTP